MLIAERVDKMCGDVGAKKQCMANIFKFTWFLRANDVSQDTIKIFEARKIVLK